MKAKRRGRPLKGAEKRKRYQITLPKRTAELLRLLGDGNLSEGIVELGRRLSE